MKILFTILFSIIGIASIAQGYIPPSNGPAGTVPGGNGTPGIIAGGPLVIPGTPTIGVTPSTLTGFSTTAGTASASQNYSLSWSHLTVNITVSAPTGFEVSIDNSTFSSTLNINYTGTSPQTIYVRISASASAGSPSGNVSNASTGATTQNVAVSGTVTAPTAAYFNFSGGSAALGTIGGITWNNFATANATTNPGTTSAQDGPTTWKVTSNGSGDWNSYGGYYGGTNNGSASGSTDPVFTNTVIRSGSLYTYDITFTSFYQFSITNLATGTYTISCVGSIDPTIFNVAGTMSFHIKVGTGSDQTLTPATFSPNNNVTKSTISISVTSGQTVQVGMFVDATCGTCIALMNAMSIVKTS